MDPGEAMYRAICRRSPYTEPNTFGQAVGWFIARAGGNVSAAARAAGVPRRTMRDWLAGKGGKTARAGDMVAAARAGERRERLRPGREKRLRRVDPGGMVVRGKYNYDGKNAPDRAASVGRFAQPNLINDVLDVFLAGGSLEQIRDAFAGNINDPSGFYSTTLGLSHENDHGWSVDEIDLEGNDEE